MPVYVIALILIALEIAAFAWLHGFNRGREDLRKQVVSSLRFSAALHRANGKAGFEAQIIARGLEEAADRIERRGVR